MSENDSQTNGEHEQSASKLRQHLLSSSTNRRSVELLRIQKALAEEDSELSHLDELLDTIFDTYPFYIDSRSRLLVERCLALIAAENRSITAVSKLVHRLEKESAKTSIAPGNAFVLIRWTSQLLQAAGTTKALWATCGRSLTNTMVSAMNTLLSRKAKSSTISTAFRVARRGFRTLLLADHGIVAEEEIIALLTTKTSAPSAKNALVLGIIAGVSSRISKCSEVVDSRKKDFFDFYIREILGSRTVIPLFVIDGLHDYFARFVTLNDFSASIVPALEKSLLRAPEIVLNNVIASTVTSLPPELDLSSTLSTQLLKPLLSNTKSSNPSVREDLLHTFQAIASRCHDDKDISKIAEEIMLPLKTNKLGSADQRQLHVNMLAALESTASIVQNVPAALLPLISKETNETVATSEILIVVGCSKRIIAEEKALSQEVLHAFTKGTADKKQAVKRAWLLGLADLLWCADPSVESSSASLEALVISCSANMITIFEEVSANPNATAQQGQIGPACAIAAVNIASIKASSILKSIPSLQRMGFRERLSTLAAKPSFLLSPRVYSRLTAQEDYLWFTRAALSVFLGGDLDETATEAWAQAIVYLISAQGVPNKAQRQAADLLLELYQSDPQRTSAAVIAGLWRWCEDVEQDAKDSAAVIAKTGRQRLFKAVRCICPESIEDEQGLSTETPSIQQAVMVKLLVLCQAPLLSNAPWIQLCLRSGVDPGALARSSSTQLWDEIVVVTTHARWSALPAFQRAAYTATAELSFVGDKPVIDMIVNNVLQDLNTDQLATIGDVEAGIYHTPEGVAYTDVLSSQSALPVLSKNSKDYDTMKWEQDLRAQLAQKKGQAKKLTAEEQAKVDAQLKKESKIRSEVHAVDARLRRGIGIIEALISGPPTQAESWFGPATQALFGVIQASSSLLLDDLASNAYLKCADRVSQRLGSTRTSIGIATLRASGVKRIPEGFLVEPLSEMVTRVLYRLRFLAEQLAFDAVTLSYAIPLLLSILQIGGTDDADAEIANEQIVLAIEVLSSHSDVFADTALPRQVILQHLIVAMGRYIQHFRDIKDCFSDVCRSIAPTATKAELETVARGAINSDSSVRGTVLSAISADFTLDDHIFYDEIWLARHDDDAEYRVIADEIWEENELTVQQDSAASLFKYINSPDIQLRRAAARSIAAVVKLYPAAFDDVLQTLQKSYQDYAAARLPQLDRYGMPMKKDVADPWEARHGISLTFKELAHNIPASNLSEIVSFLIERGPFADVNETVREGMVTAANELAAAVTNQQAVPLLELCESSLELTSTSSTQDLVNEAVVVIYGALAQHLKPGDSRVAKVMSRLLETLSTPSESVQYAVANCISPLIRSSSKDAGQYLSQMMTQALQGSSYAERRGAAYGIAGIIKGRGLSLLKEARVLSTLQGATENKKMPNQRQGAFLVYELLSLLLGRIFEPYVVQIVPQLLVGFGDTSIDVREACLDASKTCFKSLSHYGVKQILPTLLEGLDEQQWRSKKGACDSLGAMAYLDPQQLAANLPKIIPPLTEVLNDSHKEVRSAANKSLQRFGDVITNPEVKSHVGVLLKALSDPTKYTDEALDALIKVNFVHYLDAPSLALVVRILERGLGDRSATKRKASQIIGSLAHLTERKDLTVHLPILVAGLRGAIVDPVPATRATASKALGSTVEKLGEDALPDLIPSLMQTLRSDTGAGDRLGSAQALSEVLAGLGTTRLEQTLPTILQNVTSPKPAVREGFMSLFIYLPACFGNSFANYLAKVIPPILAGLADDIESIRETALRAGRLLVKNFAARSVDLLLPELERGLADDSHRIRLSSVELVGDLLFNLTGITAKADGEDIEDNANEAGQSLLELLGEEKRNKILSSLYICRNDTSGLVRSAAINIWKALVSSPRTLRELIPTLTRLLIRRLASNNMEHKVIAGNSLGELIRKAGDGVLATLLPTLESGLESNTDVDARQGICIALRELITSAAPESLEQHETTLISVVRTALVDPDEDVRDAAADAFDSLQKMIGKRAVDQVLPHLLSLLRSEDDAPNALAALLTLLTEASRANIILPNLLPTLLKHPITSFNAKAIASLAEVAGATMTRRLPNILNALLDNIVLCKDTVLKEDLATSLDAVMLSVDEFDGLNSMMSVMLGMMKNDDHRKRATAAQHFAHFFEKSELDISRYHPDLIRIFLLSFEDGDMDVVKAAWSALNALMQRLRKEEMEGLVVPARQALNHVGAPGQDLPGFTLPKGINAILPVFLQGLMNGTAEQRTQAAFAISDIVDRTNPDGLKPFVTQITGPLIRVVSERSTDLKAAILLTLTNLLEKIPTFLKPFLPQLQRTFAKSLADPSSEVLRNRAAAALGLLITMTPRVDPLIAELVTGSKTTDVGVRNAMLKALYQVVSKAGTNMSETSRNAIVGLIDNEVDGQDDATVITFARLLGALIKVLPSDSAIPLIKSRVVTNNITPASALALNALLLESPTSLASGPFAQATPEVIVHGIASRVPEISDNCVLAAGKWLLTASIDKGFEATKSIFEALAGVIAPGASIDTRRVALVVVRTVSRENNDLVRPHLATLIPPVFASVRDPVIPIKLSAEAAFLTAFNVVDEESAVFDRYLAEAGASLPAPQKRSMQEYFKRVVLKLSSQAKERKEAEGGAGGLGLTSDEQDDEREVWSIGRVDLGESTFDNQ